MRKLSVIFLPRHQIIHHNADQTAANNKICTNNNKISPDETPPINVIIAPKGNNITLSNQKYRKFAINFHRIYFDADILEIFISS